MDESTTSLSRSSATGIVPSAAVQTLLDYLVVAQPFQSGGSLADDLILAFEIARGQYGAERSTSEHAFSVISKRVDNAKRLKSKCELIAMHRYVLFRQSQNSTRTDSI